MSGPTRFQTPLPDHVRPPRVGRLRLGEKTAKGYPKSVDYFRVDEDESGITSAEAAAAFHDVYGDAPKQVRIQIPGHSIEDVLDQAYRKYSAGGLQRQCQGPGGMCSQKTSTGAWTDGECACVKAGLDPDGEPHDKNACEFNFSFSFLLPDVGGVGVWDLASGSTMSRDAIVGFLRMMLDLRGSIALLECDMRVVMKTGRAGALVPTVELRTHEQTPRELITAKTVGIEASPVPELEPGALDDPEPTIHQAEFSDPPAADLPPVAADPSDPLPKEPGKSAAGDAPTQADLDDISRQNISLAVQELTDEQKTRLKTLCKTLDVKPSSHGLFEAYGKRAENLPRLIGELEAEQAHAAQETLEGVVVE